jgi:predicted permease
VGERLNAAVSAPTFGTQRARTLIMNDIRLAFRNLRHNPVFALTAIVSVSFAVGAGATVFAVYDGVLFRPLPVANPGQVMTLSSRTPAQNFGNVSFADYSDFRRLKSFNGLIAFRMTAFGFARDKDSQPRMKAGFLASGNIFEALGIRPAVGRAFRPEEDQAPSRDAVVVLGNDFWREEFGADPDVAGKHILLNNIDFTIIGVAPSSFTGLDQFFHPDLFVPAMMAAALSKADSTLLTDRANRAFVVKGRIRPGVSVQTASAEAMSLAQALAKSFPETNRGFGATVRTELQSRLDTQQGDAYGSAFLFSLVAVLLLISCANVANLMLGRARSRTREFAVRLAIGASRARLVRSQLTECVLIALAAGVLGLIIAQAGVALASTVEIPGDIPLHLTITLDPRALLFTLALSLSSVFVFGLMPALRSTRADLVPALKAGELGSTRSGLLGRNALVVLQVACALMLMVLATQLSRGFSYLLSHNPGFETRNRLLMSFDPAIAGYTPEQTTIFYNQLLQSVSRLPGIRSAAFAHFIPTGTSYEGETVAPEGFTFPPGQQGASISAATVGENYFQTIGTPILEGRGFLPTDDSKAPLVVVVNRFFVEHYGIKNPIGKRLLIGQRPGRWAQIVGVAADGKYNSVVEPPQDFLYRPMQQQSLTAMTLIAECRSDPAASAEPIRRSVHAIAPNMPIFAVRTFDDLYHQRSVKIIHILLTVVGSMALVGVALSLIGLYAVVAYQVAQRTREIGIRMAIGASRSQVMRMVMRHAASLGVTGVAIGLLLTIAIGEGLKAALALPSFDLVLLALVAIALLFVTVAASLIPARRAALIDPMRSIRQE